MTVVPESASGVGPASGRSANEVTDSSPWVRRRTHFTRVALFRAPVYSVRSPPLNRRMLGYPRDPCADMSSRCSVPSIAPTGVIPLSAVAVLDISDENALHAPHHGA
jgi:hypothetical protein